MNIENKMEKLKINELGPLSDDTILSLEWAGKVPNNLCDHSNFLTFSFSKQLTCMR